MGFPSYYNNMLMNTYNPWWSGTTDYSAMCAGFWASNSSDSSVWTSSGSSGSAKQMSYEEYCKMRKEKEKVQEKIKELGLLEQALPGGVENIEDTKKQLEQNMKEDGSSAIVMERKKDDGFWTKAARWVSNGASAILNIGKSFIGYDENGWNWKKCLKNVAIAAGCVALCAIPGVGPVISAGLLASGVIGAGIGVYKGIDKLENATTDAEKDKAQQDIVANAFVGITSVFGLRGLGKAARLSGAAAATNSATATATGTAVKSGGLVSKLGKGIANFSKDVTVNAYKATSQNAQAGFSTAKGSGFWTTWGNNLKSMMPQSWEKRYKNRLDRMNSTLDERLNYLETEINTLRSGGASDPQRLALLREERIAILRQKQDLGKFGSSLSKKEYDKLIDENSYSRTLERIKKRQESTSPHRVGGTDVDASVLKTFYKQILKEQKAHQKELSALIKEKEAVMRHRAASGEPDFEVSCYTRGLDEVSRKLYKPSTWWKNDEVRAIGGGNTTGNFKRISGMLWSGAKTPAFSTTALTDRWINGPLYSYPFLFSQEYTKEDVELTQKELETKLQEYEEFKKKLDSIKTTEELEEFVAQINAQAQAAEQAAQQAELMEE